MPLKPGTYRLVVVCKDQVGGNVNNWEQTVTVPRLDPDTLSTSTLILADSIEKVPLRSIGTGPVRDRQRPKSGRASGASSGAMKRSASS